MSESEFPIDDMTGEVDLSESDEMNLFWRRLHMIGLANLENGDLFPVSYGKEVVEKVDTMAVEGQIDSDFVSLLNNLIQTAYDEGYEQGKIDRAEMINHGDL